MMSISSTAIDTELMRLVADVSVTRLPANRHGGEGVRDQVGGVARANENGTYDDSTVSGKAITVLSDVNGDGDVPRVINGGSVMGGSVEVIDMFSQSSSTKKFQDLCGSRHCRRICLLLLPADWPRSVFLYFKELWNLAPPCLG
jgi:hypothetical protein